MTPSSINVYHHLKPLFNGDGKCGAYDDDDRWGNASLKNGKRMAMGQNHNFYNYDDDLLSKDFLTIMKPNGGVRCN